MKIGKNALIALSLALPLTACGSTDGTEASEHVLRGSLSEEAAGEAGLEGHSVIVSTISIEGELTPIAGATDDTDADGDYELDFAQKLTADTELFVQAQTEERVLGTVAFDIDASDRMIDVPPITIDSTAESNTIVQSRDFDEICSLCMAADLEQRIDRELAAELNETAASSPSVYGEIAYAIFAGVQGRNQMLLDESVGVSAEQLSDVAETIELERETLEDELIAATDSAERAEAQLEYREAYFGAFADAGIDDDQLATGSHAETAMLAAYALDEHPAVDAELISQAELIRARLVTDSVERVFSTEDGVEPTLGEAGDALSEEIRNAANSEADARSQIGIAWDAYRAAVRGVMETELDQTGVELLESLDSDIEGATAVYAASVATLDGTQDPSLTAENAVSAVETLRGDIVFTDSILALSETGVATERAQAYLNVLFHVNAAAETTGS